MLGAHLGSPVAHTTGRTLPTGFRAATALLGHFGIEWDLRQVDADERREVAAWVALHKRVRPLLATGRLVRSDHPDPAVVVTGVVADDAAEGWYVVATVDSLATQSPAPVLLPGLDPDRRYLVTSETPDGVRQVSDLGRTWLDGDGRRAHRARAGDPRRADAGAGAARRPTCCGCTRVLDLVDDWVWDFWTAHDGERHHAFFLHAPRSLGDPDLRHRHARVGHAVSDDLVAWTRLPDALAPQPAPAFDDLATWTGSVVRDDDGTWWMFSSGLSRSEDGRVQRIGAATSSDLVTWTRTDLVLEVDPRWYAVEDHRGETHWRDPFVVRGADGRWHLYVTAKVPGTRGNGAVGHATSADLRSWSVGPPLQRATGRFDQLEVISLARVEGRWALLFSCLAPEMPGAAGRVRAACGRSPSTVRARASTSTGAVRLTTEDLYVGRVVEHAGRSVLLAFRHQGPDGRFVGGVVDPLDVTWRADGAGLRVGVPPGGGEVSGSSGGRVG